MAGDLLGQPVLTLEAVLQPGQMALWILGFDPLHGRRHDPTLNIADPRIRLVDGVRPVYAVHRGAMLRNPDDPDLALGVRAGQCRHFARTNLARNSRTSSVSRTMRATGVRATTVLAVRLIDPHRHHPVSRPNDGHSLKRERFDLQFGSSHAAGRRTFFRGAR